MFADEDKCNGIRTLYRYTQLRHALTLLRTKRIAMREPSGWEDKNDQTVIDMYRARRGSELVRVLCMTSTPDTYHHWKLYGKDNSAVAIVFNRTILNEWAKRITGLQLRSVRYVKLNDIDDEHIELHDLPFIKRWGYRSEKEWRLLYEARNPNLFSELDLPVDALMRVVINPWVSGDELRAIEVKLRSAWGSDELSISQTQMIDCKRWQDKLQSKLHSGGDAQA